MNSQGILQFVLSGGLLLVAGAIAYAIKEVRAGKVAARKSDLDSLRDILGEQRLEMTDQGRRYDVRIDSLEADLADANKRARECEMRASAAERVASALRHHLVQLESALRGAGITVPTWQEPT